MRHTAAAITEWLHQGTGKRAPQGHDSPPIEEIRAGLWLPFRAHDSECTLSMEAPDEAIYFMGDQPDAGTLRWYDREGLARWMQEHSTDPTDPDTRAPLGRLALRRFRPVYDGPFDPQLPSPPPVRLPPPPPANWRRMDACFRELLTQVCPQHTSDLQIGPRAMGAVRRSHQPYRNADGVYMDLMELPRGMGSNRPVARGARMTRTELHDAQFFIGRVMLIIMHDTVPDASVLHDTERNMLEFYSRRLGTIFCTWSYQIPRRYDKPVRIRRVPR